MPRKLLRKLLPQRRQMSGEWYLRPLAAVLHDPALWALHRKSIAKALALGLFIALLPLPGQTVLAALAAVWIRVNLPVTVAAVFVTNPITIVPIFVTAYRLGAGLLGVEPQPLTIDLSFGWLMAELTRYWQPLWAGSLLLAALTAAVGYLFANLAWRAAITLKYRQRRQGR